MTKLPCDIVKDLLPLYEDDVCSGQSKDSVEEHLSSCENCRNEYMIMHEKLPPISDAETSSLKDDIAFIKKAAKKLTSRQIIAGGIVLLIICIWFLLITLADPLFTIPADEIQVTELYQLKNGDIYCTLETDKEITGFSHAPMVVPENKLLDNYSNGHTEITLQSNIFQKISSWGTLLTAHKVTYVFTLKSQFSFEEKNVTQKSNAIYIVGKLNKRELIWKKGQKINKAPQSIEDRVAKEREKDSANHDSPDGTLIFDYFE